MEDGKMTNETGLRCVLWLRDNQRGQAKTARKHPVKRPESRKRARIPRIPARRANSLLHYSAL